MPVQQQIQLTLTPVSGGNNTNWVNIAYSLDGINGLEATLTRGSAGTDWYLTFTTDAATSIPAAGVINGVEIVVNSRASITSSTPTILAGPGITTAPASTALSTTATSYTFGGPTDTLGVTNSAGLANVCLNTRLAVATSTVFYVDSIKVNVYVTVPDGTPVALTLSNFNGGFTNPGNAATADGLYAVSSNVAFTGAGLSFDTNAVTAIPSGQAIYGIVITWKGYGTPSGMLPGSSVSSLTAPLSFSFALNSTTNTVYTVGAPDDPLSVTSSDQISTLTIRHAVSDVAGSFYVDYIGVTVYYGSPKVSASGLFFGENF